MKNNKTLSSGLILKLGVTFFLLIVFMGALYIFITAYFADKYYHETSQKLNAQLAQHLIDEKFKDKAPFLDNGEVNKALFGDIMHDMMAVNQSIEVFLLDNEGTVLYSVVLDHDDPKAPITHVNLEPVQQFITQKGQTYVLGDDPRNTAEQKIFSAAKFNVDGKEGYIYITLASKVYEQISTSVLSSYFFKIGAGATILAMVFTIIIGLLSLWFLTRSLRKILYAVKRFREGDLSSRVAHAEQSDLKLLATSFNEMADTLVKNIEDMQAVDKFRRELIANISHDLRTPLSILKGYIETLQIKDESLSKEDKEQYINIILSNSDKLSLLISQLFEYSKLESHQIEPQKEPFSITDLILDLIESYKVIAEKKKINIKLNAGKTMPLVFADISLVERAIQNLIDNAIKYTPEGGDITLETVADNENVVFRISDTGPGIKEQEQAFIFERYKQAKTSHQKEGAGLGLAIVQKIMELHNTKISLESSSSKGSTFLFYLPVVT